MKPRHPIPPNTLRFGALPIRYVLDRLSSLEIKVRALLLVRFPLRSRSSSPARPVPAPIESSSLAQIHRLPLLLVRGAPTESLARLVRLRLRRGFTE